MVKVSPKPAHKRAFLLIDQPNCGGGKGTGFHRGAPRPANPVTCFPPGKVVAPATKGGNAFPRAKRGCMVFRRAKARLSGFRRQLKTPTSPAQRYYIPPEGESPQPACKAKPITGRTLGAQGRQARRRHQPSRRSRANLREYRFPPFPSQRPITSNVAHSKKALTITVSAFSVNQQLPILPGRFQPSTFGVCELNYRVRHGYGCILTAIATESLRVCSLKTA